MDREKLVKRKVRGKQNFKILLTQIEPEIKLPSHRNLMLSNELFNQGHEFTLRGKSMTSTVWKIFKINIWLSNILNKGLISVKNKMLCNKTGQK